MHIYTSIHSQSHWLAITGATHSFFFVIAVVTLHVTTESCDLRFARLPLVSPCARECLQFFGWWEGHYSLLIAHVPTASFVWWIKEAIMFIVLLLGVTRSTRTSRDVTWLVDVACDQFECHVYILISHPHTCDLVMLLFLTSQLSVFLYSKFGVSKNRLKITWLSWLPENIICWFGTINYILPK